MEDRPRRAASPLDPRGINAISIKTISPANMFPIRRMASESILEKYSTICAEQVSGNQQHNHQRIVSMKRSREQLLEETHRRLGAKAKDDGEENLEIDIPRVWLMSAVGTTRR